MKLSIVFFTAMILYVSAGPLSESPSVRGPSQGCKDKWTQTCSGLSTVTAVGKVSLAQVAVLQMCQMSYWFVATTAQLQLNIDGAVTMAASFNYYMNLYYPTLQITYIQTAIQTMVTCMTASVNAVKAVNTAQAAIMQQQLTMIQTNMTAIVTQLQACSVGALTMMTGVSDATLTMITATVQSCAQLQNSCAVSYSSSNSQSNIAALLMDIIFVGSAAKAAAAAVVNTVVSTTCSAIESAASTSISLQVTAMQSSATVTSTAMSVVSTTVTASYAVMITELYMQSEFDVAVAIAATAGLEQGNTDCTSETQQNITQTNTEFTQMCSNSSDADSISACANNYTSQITAILQSSSSMTVQSCANLAISAILIEQTNGQNGIGQCVSDGKSENDKDMQDIQQNFTACAQENQQNLTKCTDKYKDPNYTGHSAANTDSGSTKSEMVDSCQKKHTDKDMKKFKGHSDEKCKRHKKGGDNYEKVKKCKSDQKDASVTKIISIYANFQVCITVSFG